LRGNGRWLITSLPVVHLERLRTKLAYEPSVIDACYMHWGGPGWTENEARGAEAAFGHWQRELLERRENARRGRTPLPGRLHDALGGAVEKPLHFVDLRLQGGGALLRVRMSGVYFADRLDFDLEDIV